MLDKIIEELMEKLSEDNSTRFAQGVVYAMEVVDKHKADKCKYKIIPSIALGYIHSISGCGKKLDRIDLKELKYCPYCRREIEIDNGKDD